MRRLRAVALVTAVAGLAACASPTGTIVPAAGSDDATVAAARSKIDHVVFLIKENRTFDTLFGRFPGADGATSGTNCDGETVPLGPAPDRVPDYGHSFTDGKWDTTVQLEQGKSNYATDRSSQVVLGGVTTPIASRYDQDRSDRALLAKTKVDIGIDESLLSLDRHDRVLRCHDDRRRDVDVTEPVE